MRRKNIAAFTLIELLIVIAIILILIAIALPNFLEAQLRAKVVRVKADMRTIATAQEMYLQDWNQYAPRSEDEFTGHKGLIQLTTPLPYLPELPFDVFVGGGAPADQANNQRPVFWEMCSTGPPMNFAASGYRAYKGINAFALYSHGPAIVDNFQGEGRWPFGGNGIDPCLARTVKTINYSPTNGTKSQGNIHQFGGSWRAGNWCMDELIIRGSGAEYNRDAPYTIF